MVQNAVFWPQVLNYVKASLMLVDAQLDEGMHLTVI